MDSPQDITDGWPGLSEMLEDGREGVRGGSMILRFCPHGQRAGGALTEGETGTDLGRDAELTFGHTREIIGLEVEVSRLGRGLGPDKSGQTSWSDILWITMKCSKCPQDSP